MEIDPVRIVTLVPPKPRKFLTFSSFLFLQHFIKRDRRSYKGENNKVKLHASVYKRYSNALLKISTLHVSPPSLTIVSNIHTDGRESLCGVEAEGRMKRHG